MTQAEPNSSSLSCCFYGVQRVQPKSIVILTQCDKQQTAGWRANLHILSELLQPPDAIIVLFLPNRVRTYSSHHTRNATSHSYPATRQTGSQISHLCELPAPTDWPTCYLWLSFPQNLKAGCHCGGKNLKSTIINKPDASECPVQSLGWGVGSVEAWVTCCLSGTWPSGMPAERMWAPLWITVSRTLAVFPTGSHFWETPLSEVHWKGQLWLPRMSLCRPFLLCCFFINFLWRMC